MRFNTPKKSNRDNDLDERIREFAKAKPDFERLDHLEEQVKILQRRINYLESILIKFTHSQNL